MSAMNHRHHHHHHHPPMSPPTPPGTGGTMDVARSMFSRLRRCRAGLTPVLLLVIVAASVASNLAFAKHPVSHNASSDGDSSRTLCIEAAAPLPPVPGRNRTVSAVVMNHARPEVLQRGTLLRTLASHPSVARVLVLHSQPVTAFDNAALAENDGVGDKWLDKLAHIDVQEENREMGLALRFHFCAESVDKDTDLVVVVDDDMEMDGATISRFVAEMEADPRRIVGYYGRTFDEAGALLGDNGNHGYSLAPFYDNVEVVLTKAMILERRICREFGRLRDVMADMVQESKPKWNGEDIFVNLVANRVYGVPPSGPYHNYAVRDLHIREADVARLMANATKLLTLSISGYAENKSGQVSPEMQQAIQRKAAAHIKFRGLMWQTAKRRLSEIPYCGDSEEVK